MGTWDEGVLDNDTACDALGDLCFEIGGDIERLGAAGETDALCAAVGVLLQLSDYDFAIDTERGQKIVAAAKASAANIAGLPADARRVMELVMDGKGQDLAKQPDPAFGEQTAILNRGDTDSRFGERHAALFATTAGAAYVQSIADRCVASIEDALSDESNWSDLCREAGSMGLLAVLFVIAPCTVPPATIESWRTKARTGLATLRERDDDELDFHEAYHANLERAFDVVAARFAR